MEFRPADPQSFHVDLAAHALPDAVTLAQAHYSPLDGKRSRALIGDGRDDYQLMIHSTEHEVSVDGKAPITVAAGDLMIVSQAVWTECRLPETWLRVVALERTRLARLLPRIDARGCYIIPAATPGLRLFAGYAELLRQSPPGDAEAAALAARHLYDLVAHLLGGVVPGDTARAGGGIGAARLALVKKEILARLTDPELDIGAIARRQGVTPRYIQRLFAAEGASFTEYLRESRLQLAIRSLREDRTGSIADIAFAAGFQDLSHFNRVFRRRFGCTPSDVRAEALAGRSG
ncbi:AraC family transcriptional regulator [Kaistia sp. 32K]|nr:AraC family transcriptional regulator [Kaistia sp. 32K]